MRERDRYGRASLGEQAVETVRAYWRNRTARTVILILVGMLVVYRLITPDIVRMADLREGDCLYVNAPGAGIGVQVEPPGSVAGRLRTEGAERADCSLSHGHEVSAVLDLADPMGAAYAGEGPLADRERARCAEAFERYVGRSPDGSVYETFVVVPGPDEWADGDRRAVCLVSLGSREFMSGPARGSDR